MEGFLFLKKHYSTERIQCIAVLMLKITVLVFPSRNGIDLGRLLGLFLACEIVISDS